MYNSENILKQNKEEGELKKSFGEKKLNGELRIKRKDSFSL